MYFSTTSPVVFDTYSGNEGDYSGYMVSVLK